MKGENDEEEDKKDDKCYGFEDVVDRDKPFDIEVLVQDGTLELSEQRDSGDVGKTGYLHRVVRVVAIGRLQKIS